MVQDVDARPSESKINDLPFELHCVLKYIYIKPPTYDTSPIVALCRFNSNISELRYQVNITLSMLWSSDEGIPACY